MTQPNLQQPDYKTWWLLKKIKSKLLENPGKNTVTILIHVMPREPAIPDFQEQESILRKLQKDSVVRVYKVPETGAVVFIGVDEYSITVLQPQFDNLYQAHEEVFSINKRSPDLARINSFSDETKKKISQTIDTILEKYELKNLAGNTGTISELSIPIEDFLKRGMSRDDLQNILIITGKEADFVPYFHNSSTNIDIEFNPVLLPEKTTLFLSKMREGIKTVNQNEKTNKLSNKFPHKLRAGTKWEDFVFKFLDKEHVLVDVHKDKINIELDFRQMGFEDKRSSKPDSQWALLMILAKRNGEIEWKNSEAEYKFKKCKERLTTQLQDYFSVDYDPFHPYRDTKSYKIKITLIPLEEENNRQGGSKISQEISKMFAGLQEDD